MKQLGMFSQGEDLPLFSGTPQQVEVKPFAPVEAAQQTTWAKCPVCRDLGKVDGRFCACPAGQRAWIDQRKRRIVVDAMMLSSGTIAGLIGDNRYTVIEQVQADFTKWCEALDADTVCQTWQDAWGRFWAEYGK